MPLRPLLLCLVGLLGATATADVLAEPARVLTFIEVRSDGADRCKTTLNEYAGAERQRSTRALVLQELARPEKFVLVEKTERAEDLTGAGTKLEEALSTLLTAPPDRRNNREFGDAGGAAMPAPSAAMPAPSAAAAAAAPAAAPPAPSPAASPAAPADDAGTNASVYVVAHVDMTPAERVRGEAALLRLREAARKSDGNLRFDVWQQTDRANHFNLIAVWTRRAKFNEFAAGAAAREFRKSVASALGSPYDERLYRRAQ